MKVDEHEAEICRLQNELNSLKTQGAGEDVDPKSPLGKVHNSLVGITSLSGHPHSPACCTCLGKAG